MALNEMLRNRRGFRISDLNSNLIRPCTTINPSEFHKEMTQNFTLDTLSRWQYYKNKILAIICSQNLEMLNASTTAEFSA